jgi:hypothetical protein
MKASPVQPCWAADHAHGSVWIPQTWSWRMTSVLAGSRPRGHGPHLRRDWLGGLLHEHLQAMTCRVLGTHRLTGTVEVTDLGSDEIDNWLNQRLAG